MELLLSPQNARYYSPAGLEQDSLTCQCDNTEHGVAAEPTGCPFQGSGASLACSLPASSLEPAWGGPSCEEGSLCSSWGAAMGLLGRIRADSETLGLGGAYRLEQLAPSAALAGRPGHRGCSLCSRRRPPPPRCHPVGPPV